MTVRRAVLKAKPEMLRNSPIQPCNGEKERIETENFPDPMFHNAESFEILNKFLGKNVVIRRREKVTVLALNRLIRARLD